MNNYLLSGAPFLLIIGDNAKAHHLLQLLAVSLSYFLIS
jgi:hypothetical protein